MSKNIVNCEIIYNFATIINQEGKKIELDRGYKVLIHVLLKLRS